MNGRFRLRTGMVVAGFAVILGSARAEANPRERQPAAPPDFIAVAGDTPWAIALATPVAARLRQEGRLSLLIAVTNTPTREADGLATLAASRRSIVLAGESTKLSAALRKGTPVILSVDGGPTTTSLLVAHRYWSQASSVVMAAANDPEATILASSLAALLDAPLILREAGESRPQIGELLDELGVQNVLIAASEPKTAPTWSDAKQRAAILGLPEIQRRVVAALGPRKIKNIVLARVPEARGSAGQSAWLASYVSIARGAAVVLCHSASAAVAEADVAQFVAEHRLQPRTVTVLADYGSIGCNTVDLEYAVRYTVKTEPCMPRGADEVALFGVGRIPFESLEDASVFFARGLLRERLLADRPQRLLMVANAGAVRRPLPLCETISRLTAEEFKNFDIPVDEFYGKLADSPDILLAARQAGLIIYEGHLAYQDIFDVPVLGRASDPDTYFQEELDDLEGGDRQPADAGREATPAASASSTTTPGVTVPTLQPVPDPARNHLQGPLAGMPIVFLQSCDSLEEPVLWRIDEMGGVAVVGSMTPVHSGSGSALVKTLADAVLYRGDTLGEALRDAQNYLFCLEDLRARTGSKDQGKSRRVALSFRLWGDPELAVFPGRGDKPRQLPVALRTEGRNRLAITLPEHRLPEIRTEKYYARLFPGSQWGGMAKQREGETARRLVPVYYGRVALPNGFLIPANAVLVPPEGSLARASFRLDPLHKLLYVVFCPEQDNPGETIALRMASERQVVPAGKSKP